MLKKQLTEMCTATRYGLIRYYENDIYIGHALEKYGEYSEAEPQLWRKFVKPGDIVIDAGANIGVFTLALADMVGRDGEVHAFEAQYDTFKLLTKNAETHTNTYLHFAALSDDCATIKMPFLVDLPNKNYGGVEVDKNAQIGMSTRMITLDSCFEPTTKIAFIKLDVEGMEAEVLRGAQHMIKKHRPILYVENDRSEKSAELIKLLHDYGYHTFEHLPPLYQPNNFKKADISNERCIVSLNLLCVPEKRLKEFAPIIEGLKSVQPAKPPEPRRKVSTKKDWACVVRLGGIGDNLIAASTLRPLKEQGYMIEVISQGIQAVVFENNPFVDRLTIKAQKEIPQDNPVEWQKYWWARSCEYAKFINLSHSVEVLMAQFPQSTAFWWPPEFRRKMCGASYLEAAHDVVGVPHHFGPLFFPTEEEVEDIVSFKQRHGLDQKPLIAWVISGTRIDKLYPFAALAISRLLAEIDCNVIMLSAPSPQRPDAENAKQIMEHIKLTNSSTKGLYEARHVEGAHNWPIRRMLTLAMQSDLVIGPDTGVMWAVAMEDVPKILLHSHASATNITGHWKRTISLIPDATKVRCWPCHLLHDGIDTCQEVQIQSGMNPSTEDRAAACIGSLPVNQVLVAAKGALGNIGFLSQLRDDFGGVTVIR